MGAPRVSFSLERLQFWPPTPMRTPLHGNRAGETKTCILTAKVKPRPTVFRAAPTGGHNSHDCTSFCAEILEQLFYLRYEYIAAKKSPVSVLRKLQNFIVVNIYYFGLMIWKQKVNKSHKKIVARGFIILKYHISTCMISWLSRISFKTCRSYTQIQILVLLPKGVAKGDLF